MRRSKTRTSPWYRSSDWRLYGANCSSNSTSWPSRDPMPNENDPIDIQRLIAEVGARDNVFLKPDDPAIALVTMNRLILDDAMETVNKQIRATIAEFHASMQKAERRAGSMLAQGVKESAVQMQQGLQNDIYIAGLKCRDIV